MNPKPKVIAFDIFGTVVDWHGSIAAEVQRLKLPVDSNAFATAWRKGYQPAMAWVRSGELPWTKIDDLHRMTLDGILEDFSLTTLSESDKQHLNLVWHRLNPWPDSVQGLTQLKSKFTIVTLSNGNLSLLANMAKHGALPWDLILSAEVFKHYKPDPETYLGVAHIFDLQPHEVMLEQRTKKICSLRTIAAYKRHLLKDLMSLALVILGKIYNGNHLLTTMPRTSSI